MTTPATLCSGSRLARIDDSTGRVKTSGWRGVNARPLTRAFSRSRIRNSGQRSLFRIGSSGRHGGCPFNGHFTSSAYADSSVYKGETKGSTDVRWRIESTKTAFFDRSGFGGWHHPLKVRFQVSGPPPITPRDGALIRHTQNSRGNLRSRLGNRGWAMTPYT